MIADVTPPSDELLQAIVDGIECADADELTASCPGQSPLQVLRASREASYECFVGLADGKPIGIFGISLGSPEGDVGHPWAIFTVEGRKHVRTIIETSKHVVSRWRAFHDVLTNVVDSRNTRAIRWLKSLGFEFGEPFPLGDTTFLPFYWSNHV